MKRILVDMTASILHHGHIRLLQKAKEFGHVVVALTTDAEVEKYKGYKPELSFEHRKEILLALKCVDEVVPSPWLIDQQFMDAHNADLIVHSGFNANPAQPVQLYERTDGISSSEIRERAVRSIIQQFNSNKCLLTPGPTNIHPEHLLGQRPVFTRGDEEFQRLQESVLERIRELAGQSSIVAVPGSATTAIEVATTNFVQGDVAVVITGYYSQRIFEMLERKQELLNLSKLVPIAYSDFVENGSAMQKFDWILAAYTETADAFRSDMTLLRQIATQLKSRLMIDATGSINLEDGHELADVCVFSSCKGLGGMTGAGFITFNQELLGERNGCKKEFILDLDTYIERKTTGPAHTLCSLALLVERFAELRQAVLLSKQAFVNRFEPFLYRSDHQPTLCTKVVGANLKLPAWAIGYSPRSIEPGCQVVCHLFDQFPSNKPPGSVYESFEVQALRVADHKNN